MSNKYKVGANAVQASVHKHFKLGESFRTSEIVSFVKEEVSIHPTTVGRTLGRMNCLESRKKNPIKKHSPFIWKVISSPQDEFGILNYMSPRLSSHQLEETLPPVPDDCVECSFAKPGASGCIPLEKYREERDRRIKDAELRAEVGII